MSYQQQPGYPGSAPSPYGAPKKDNTLMWVLGGIGALLLLCCCGVLGFLGWGAWVAQDAYDSVSSSYSSDSAGSAVSEGDSASIDGGTVVSGWTISEDEIGLEPQSVRVRNDDDYAKSFTFYVNFLSNGSEVDDAFCSTGSIEPGATGNATCLPALDNVDYDELSISEY